MARFFFRFFYTLFSEMACSRSSSIASDRCLLFEASPSSKLILLMTFDSSYLHRLPLKVIDHFRITVLLDKVSVLFITPLATSVSLVNLMHNRQNFEN